MEMSTILALSQPEQDTTTIRGSIFSSYMAELNMLSENQTTTDMMDFSNRIMKYSLETLDIIRADRKKRFSKGIENLKSTYRYTIIETVPTLFFAKKAIQDIDDLHQLILSQFPAPVIKNKLRGEYNKLQYKNRKPITWDKCRKDILNAPNPIPAKDYAKACYDAYREAPILLDQVTEEDLFSAHYTERHVIKERDRVILEFRKLHDQLDRIYTDENTMRAVSIEVDLDRLVREMNAQLTKQCQLYVLAYAAKLDAIVERELVYNEIKRRRKAI